jgi:hypothetical protein
MDFEKHIQHVCARKKPLSSQSLKTFVDHHSGIDFKYIWDPIGHIFRRDYGNTPFIQSANTIVILFAQERVAIRIGLAQFQEENPMLPTEMLKNHVQIIYRNQQSQCKVLGCKLIITTIHPKMLICNDGKTVLDYLMLNKT